MKKLLRSALPLLLLALVLASCTTFTSQGLAVVKGDSQYTKLGTFTTTVHSTKWLGSAAGATLFNLGSDATDKLVRNAVLTEIEAKGGTAAIDVNVTYQATFVDMILNYITGDIYAPATLVITGTVVK